MTPSRLLLGFGYALAIPPTLLFLRIAWRRLTGWFVVAAAALVTDRHVCDTAGRMAA